MNDSNIHPIFEDILNAVAPSKRNDSTGSALDLAEDAIRKSNILLSGFNRIAAALDIPGTTLETIRQISLDTMEKVTDKK